MAQSAIPWSLMTILLFCALGGCAVVTTTATVVSTAVGLTVDAAGAVVDAAMPDGDDKDAR